MDDKTFNNVLEIMQKHVDFLEANKDNGVFSKKENEELIKGYKDEIEKGKSLLKEED